MPETSLPMLNITLDNTGHFQKCVKTIFITSLDIILMIGNQTFEILSIIFSLLPVWLQPAYRKQKFLIKI